MKRIGLLLSLAAITLVTACTEKNDTENNGKTELPKPNINLPNSCYFTLVRDGSMIDVDAKTSNDGSYLILRLDNTNTYATYDYIAWQTAMNEQYGKQMYNEIVAHHDGSYSVGLSFRYIWDTIENISLKADIPIFGRQSGQELIDLFKIRLSQYVPHGDGYGLWWPEVSFDSQEVQFDIEYNTLFEMEDFIDREFLVQDFYNLYPKHGVALRQLPKDAIFTMTIDFASKKSLTCNFTLDF